MQLTATSASPLMGCGKMDGFITSSSRLADLMGSILQRRRSMRAALDREHERKAGLVNKKADLDAGTPSKAAKARKPTEHVS